MPVDVIGLAPGRQRYGMLLNENAGILDDLMFTRRATDFLVIVNGACKVADTAHIQAHIGARCQVTPLPDAALLAKWTRIREIRDAVNKDIEALRSAGQVGASLQAEVTLTVNADDHARLASLGEDLKFVFITSALQLHSGAELGIQSKPSTAVKCERCWHYRDDVGHDAAHPTLCGRCTSNLYGAGETRTCA
jgi:isoleucyl-tRNA synthetase